MAKYIISLDQGTTSSRAIAFNHEGLSVASVNKEFASIIRKMAGLNMMQMKFFLHNWLS